MRQINTVHSKTLSVCSKILPNYINTETKRSKTLFNDFTVKMPESQYLGCKFKILPWIFKHIPKDVKTVLDSFAGSQSFSFHSKKVGYTDLYE